LHEGTHKLSLANIAEEKVMYAVVETGGKQYKVSAGETIQVEKLPLQVGQQVELDRVLLVSEEGQVRVGDPTVEGARVMATVAGQGKSRKVIVFKYKPHNRYRRKAGHRQTHTRLRIDQIIV
jgi:large subunit ribosomal protein L21